jgi:hypothetical protein
MVTANNQQSLKADPEVKRAFERISMAKATDTAKCKHCGKEQSWNTLQNLKPYLKKCTKYIQWKIENGKS